MLYYLFILGHSSYVTVSLGQKTSILKAYSNLDFLTDNVNKIA